MSAGDIEAEPVDDGGPGVIFVTHVLMEDLYDKLKLLDYDKEFMRKTSASSKPISRHYFALQTNPGEQFFLFTNVSAWLIQKTGNPKFEMPQEHDDPNATISKILDELRRLDVFVDFPPSKLKSGAGEQCVFVLDRLADAALKHTDFAWSRPVAAIEEDVEEPLGVDESEITAEQFEEEEADAADDDDDGGFLDLEALKNLSGKRTGDREAKKEILQSDTDAAEWKLEVERVMPSLRIQIRPDAKDWRQHLEQMQQYKSSIQETLTQTQTQLEKLSGEVGKNLDKITSREKYLNQQLESLLNQFRQTQDRVAEIKEKYKEASGGVTDRSRTLAQISDDLDQIKQEMEERSSSNQSGAPVVKAKQAIAKLQQELIGINVQIGVIEQSLLQSQLRDRTNLQNDMNAAAAINSEFAF